MIFLLLFSSSPALYAATGCNYPSALDTISDVKVGDELTTTIYNKLGCMAQNIEAELGVLPKGSYASVAARLDAATYSAFKTISVSGQSDVIADSASDILTLVAGTNVTITTNATTDTITIAATDTGITQLTGGVIAGPGSGSQVATVVTNANLTGPITSVGNATSIASQTGTGTKFVVDTSPTLATPILTAPDINAGTADSLTSLSIRSTGTGAFDLTFANSENLTLGKTLTFVVGDTSRTLTVGASASVSGSNTGDQTITLTGDVTGSGTGSFATTIAADSVALGTDTTGNYVASVATTSPLTGGAVGSEGAILTLACATCVTTATTTGTNTGDQLVFKTISVSGQSDVVADTITDTLTLAAGTNVTITTDATTDTITIAAADTGITQLTGGVTAGPGSGSQAATVVTNANLTGPITSVGNATSIASQTGTGTKFVVDTSPTLATAILTTPDINAGTADSLTSLSIRSTGTGAFDLTFANSENLTLGKTLTFAVGDTSRTLTIGASASISGSNTGDQTITLTGDVTGSGTGSFATTIAADSVALGTDTTGDYVSSATANQGLLLTGTEGASLGLIDCAANQILKRNAGDTAWECAADSTAGTPSFDAITGGTNTTAAMIVSTGASLATSGSGTIVATSTTANAVTLGMMATGTAGNLITYSAAGAPAAVATGTAAQVLTSNGAGAAPTFQAASGGSADTWTSITAATGAATTANANNTGIVLNWAVTTNSVSAWTFGETTAATGGTDASGVPNQVLLKLTTLATSTMSPLSVYSRGSHVFSVSPSTVQLITANGTRAAPVYSFASDLDLGFYWTAADQIGVSTGNTNYTNFSGSATVGALAVSGQEVSASSGMNLSAVVSVNENGTRIPVRIHRAATTDAADGSVSLLRSRGNAASPTVITSGDNLGNLAAYGYVGATNKFQQAAQILFDSAGTISDSATGIAGIIRFYTAATGAEPVEKWAMDDTGNLLSAGVLQASLGTPANGSIIYCSDCTIANPCAGAGTGAIAKRLNGVWVCN